MIYQGYTTAEIEELSACLDGLAIPYAISADNQAIEEVHAEIKRKSPSKHDQLSSTNNSFWQIEIKDDVLRAIPKEQHATLERYRIFPSLVDFVPDFSAPVAPQVFPQKKVVGMNGFLALLLFIAVLAYIWVTWLK
jgi:hypothetical protein